MINVCRIATTKIDFFQILDGFYGSVGFSRVLRQSFRFKDFVIYEIVSYFGNLK
jgi:hypothetical protein